MSAASAGGAATGDRRIALVIGNGAYDHMKKLANPPRDAALIAAKLRSVGFEVDLAIDDDLLNLELRVRAFALQASGASAALFYYAGHGIQADGRNYLVPVDAELRSAADLPARSLPMSKISEALDFANAKINLVILDACRNNPLTRSLMGKNGARSAQITRGGLAAMPRASGKLVAYATAPGDVAYEGTGQQNSPFTQAVADWIEEPGLEVVPMFQRVREQVMAATGGKQVPWIDEAISGDFYFRPTPSDVEPAFSIVSTEPAASLPTVSGEQASAKSPLPSGPKPNDPIETAWAKTTDLGTRDAYLEFLELYPESDFAQQAVGKLLQFASPKPQTTPALQPAAVAPAPKVAGDQQSAQAPLSSDPQPNDPIETAWSRTTALDTRDAYIAFLAQYPDSQFAPEAVAKLLRFAGLATPSSNADLGPAARRQPSASSRTAKPSH